MNDPFCASKKDGLSYTDCDFDLDLSITTYNNCNGDFPNQNGFDVNFFILDNNYVHDLCVCSSILILKKVKDLFNEMKKNDLVEFFTK